MIISPYIDPWLDHRTDEERKRDEAEYYKEKEAGNGKIGLAGNVKDLKVKKIIPAIASNFFASAQNLG